MCFPASPWFWSSVKQPQATSQLCPPAAAPLWSSSQQGDLFPPSKPPAWLLQLCPGGRRSEHSHKPSPGRKAAAWLFPSAGTHEQGRLYHLCCFLWGTDKMTSLAAGRKTKRGWGDTREQRQGTVLSNLLLLFWLCR